VSRNEKKLAIVVSLILIGVLFFSPEAFVHVMTNVIMYLAIPIIVRIAYGKPVSKRIALLIMIPLWLSFGILVNGMRDKVQQEEADKYGLEHKKSNQFGSPALYLCMYLGYTILMRRKSNDYEQLRPENAISDANTKSEFLDEMRKIVNEDVVNFISNNYSNALCVSIRSLNAECVNENLNNKDYGERLADILEKHLASS